MINERERKLLTLREKSLSRISQDGCQGQLVVIKRIAIATVNIRCHIPLVLMVDGSLVVTCCAGGQWRSQLQSLGADLTFPRYLHQ